MSGGPILVAPAHEAGRGGGHLSRCIILTQELRAMEREAWLYLPYETNKLLDSRNFDLSMLVTKSGLHDKNWELIILDRFQTSDEELSFWKKTAPVIGIDEGGSCRDNFDFLVDILPNINKVQPNISEPLLLPLPKKNKSESVKKNAERANIKILISFGHEDSAGLGIAAARVLSARNNERMEITFLCGALAQKAADNPPNIRRLETIPSLAEHLCEYDLVITHYGITAFESLYAGTPILLIKATSYHEKLAKAAGFISFSKPSSLKHIDEHFLSKLKKHCEKLAAKYGMDKENKSLAAMSNLYKPIVNRRCPVCDESVSQKSVFRFSERTYRRCRKCGVIYMDRSTPPPVEYEKEYFFEFYKKQYGKTYIEDFPNLTAMADRRLKIIKSFLPAGKKHSVMDIGCAYGAFLAAAKEKGFIPSGIDPAQDAVNYVQKELGIGATHGFFPDCSLPELKYNVITLWYVIEHFTNCASALDAIKKHLSQGGILAFSTPSFSGISTRVSLKNFLSKSPGDHFTIWSPQMCAKALALAGFKVKKIVSSGHHPERFPLFGRFAKSKRSPLYWLFLAVSRIFCLGDTFEVYAEYIK